MCRALWSDRLGPLLEFQFAGYEMRSSIEAGYRIVPSAKNRVPIFLSQHDQQFVRLERLKTRRFRSNDEAAKRRR
jgi:hypothetical protein